MKLPSLAANLPLRHDFVEIRQDWRAKEMKRKEPDPTMPSIIKSEAERARAQHAALTKLYRPIGSGAVAAALVCMRKAKKTPKPA